MSRFPGFRCLGARKGGAALTGHLGPTIFLHWGLWREVMPRCASAFHIVTPHQPASLIIARRRCVSRQAASVHSCASDVVPCDRVVEDVAREARRRRPASPSRARAPQLTCAACPGTRVDLRRPCRWRSLAPKRRRAACVAARCPRPVHNNSLASRLALGAIARRQLSRGRS